MATNTVLEDSSSTDWEEDDDDDDDGWWWWYFVLVWRWDAATADAVVVVVAVPGEPRSFFFGIVFFLFFSFLYYFTIIYFYFLFIIGLQTRLLILLWSSRRMDIVQVPVLVLVRKLTVLLTIFIWTSIVLALFVGISLGGCEGLWGLVRACDFCDFLK